MKRFFHFLFASTLLASCFLTNSYACTTFCLKNSREVLFGKNYDWMIGDGMILVNKRGVSKVSSEEENPAKWVSKYGSVTFNQYGWESPSGGMNEEGLVIELMWLDDTEYPEKDDRPTVDVLEWIQYNLDTSASTESVIRNSEAVRISSSVKLHYLVSDRFGNSATMEFLDGKLVAHSGERLPYAALTNDTYDRSVEYSKKTAPATSESSLDRFARAAVKTREFEIRPFAGKNAVIYAFDLLGNVAQKSSTQWSIVYDQRRGRVYWRTKKRPDLKSIDTASLDYSCGSPVKSLDVDYKDSGDVTAHLGLFTRQANRELIERSFDGTDFLKKVPAQTRDRLAEFPERFVCAAKSPKTRTLDPRSLVATAELSNFLSTPFPLYHIFAALPR